MRQHNVQQQNSLEEQSLRSEVKHWRENGVPEALRKVGEERGVNWSRSIVIDLQVNFPGMPSYFGTVVTQDERFIYFEVEESNGVEVEEWTDVTEEQNVNEHNRGIGVGRGALAIKILRGADA
jgi:hypothetical protein